MEWILFFSQQTITIDFDFPLDLKEAWAQFARAVLELRQTLDPAIWVLSIVLALVPGSFAIYKWWLYRKSRLPERIEAILKDHDQRIIRARPELTRLVQSAQPPSRSLSVPVFATHSLSAVLSKANWAKWWNPFRFRITESNLNLALESIQEKSNWCTSTLKIYRDHEATVILLKGAMDAAEASKCRPQTATWERLNRAALNHFARALALEPDNPEIIEYVAHQHRVLDDVELARDKYLQIAEITKNRSEEKELFCRSLMHAAEMSEILHERSNVGSRLDDAKKLIYEALDRVPESILNRIEHARLLEIAGRISDKKKMKRDPGIWLRAAQSIYEDITTREPQNSEARLGSERTFELNKSFETRVECEVNADQEPSSSRTANPSP